MRLHPALLLALAASLPLTQASRADFAASGWEDSAKNNGFAKGVHSNYGAGGAPGGNSGFGAGDLGALGQALNGGLGDVNHAMDKLSGPDSCDPAYWDNPDFKNQRDLDRYFRDTSPMNWMAYRSYRPMIDAAARAFNLPAQFLACIVAQESSWNPAAHSGAGAMGIAQIMPTTMDEIAADYRRSNPGAASAPTSAAEEDAYQAALDRRSGTQGGWAQYFALLKSARERGEIQAAGTIEGGRKNAKADLKQGASEHLPGFPDPPPSNLKRQDAYNPLIAIGAMGAYFRKLIDTLRRNSGGLISDEEARTPSLTLLAVTAGAYNMGPGRRGGNAGALGLLRRSGNTLEGWKQAILHYANDETRGYVAKLLNCMQRTAGGEPAGKKGKE